MKPVKAFAINSKQYSPQEFLKISDSEKSLIKSSKIIQPKRIGDGLKSYIEVIYIDGVYYVEEPTK